MQWFLEIQLGLSSNQLIKKTEDKQRQERGKIVFLYAETNSVVVTHVFVNILTQDGIPLITQSIDCIGSMKLMEC